MTSNIYSKSRRANERDLFSSILYRYGMSASSRASREQDFGYEVIAANEKTEGDISDIEETPGFPELQSSPKPAPSARARSPKARQQQAEDSLDRKVPTRTKRKNRNSRDLESEVS